MTSVDSNLNKFSVWTSTWGLTPPPSTCVHLSLNPLPLCVVVINGWPLSCACLRTRKGHEKSAHKKARSAQKRSMHKKDSYAWFPDKVLHKRNVMRAQTLKN